ncbi:MAG: IS256 family transposase [candidate division Zixibacteria bacterium]|jgi:transposase-like protein|nr:IS256 family transposase [candidate division Zixibacteria bacterium]
MSQKQLDFSKHNLTIDLAEVKRMFREDLSEGGRYLLEEFFHQVMVHDLYEHIRARWHERTLARGGYRNGYRERYLLILLGLLKLNVPRDREGTYQPDCFERYKRVQREVDEGIKEMFLRGVSTRKVGEVLDAFCGERVSASYVSRVTKALDEEVKAFHNSPIEDDFVFLFLDAISLRVRLELKVKRYSVLVAYGIKPDGSRKLINFRLSKSEGRGSWSSFLENLKVRGLAGHNLKLIIMDGCAGLWSAIEEVYPLVPHQLCWVHKLRNIAKYCPKRYRESCTKEAAKIMYAKTSGMAAKLFRQWKACWINLIPKAVECLEKDFDRLIPFFEFSPEFHRVIRTTNVIERSFGEVRRRLKVMGYFQNTRSCNRIIFSLFFYFNNKWERRTERIKPIAEYFQTAA